ncbi:MAG: site-2 protease family protein [Candidatus Micrarchaeaceae archaeon]
MLVLMPGLREHVRLSSEITDMLIADAVLTIAFALLYSGGVGGLRNDWIGFFYFLPISFMAVSLAFILHEYMHKVVAQRFGAIAAFKRWDSGIMITLVSSLFGFLIGLPGATMIYTNRFTEREDGLVSLAGPLTNFAVFIAFMAIGIIANSYFVVSKYINDAIGVTLFISVWLAFFNMLPVYPLDGSKVLRWNKKVYAVTMAVIFAFLYYVAGAAILPELAFALVIAFVFSVIYSGMRMF